MHRIQNPSSRFADLVKTMLTVSLPVGCLWLGGQAAWAQGPAANLPASIREAGVIHMATYAGFPPLEYHAPGTNEIVGLEIDLARAIADELGVKVVVADTPFEGIIPGLMSQRYDMAITDMSDTKKRQQQVDFVDYGSAFSSILVAKGNPHHIKSLADLCGLPIGTQQSSLQFQQLTEESRRCVDAGKPAIKIAQFPNEAQIELELMSGRTVAQVRDFALGSYQAEHSGGALEIVRTDSGPARVGKPGPVGIAVAKGNTELAMALKVALENLLRKGTYKEIFRKYDLLPSAIEQVTINGGDQ